MVQTVWMAWALGTLMVFWLRPGAMTASVALIAGWALLPTADFEHFDQVAAVEHWLNVRGVALPQPVFWTRASFIGLVSVAAVVLFDVSRLRRLSFFWFDAPIVAWCLMPLLSGVSAGVGAQTLALNTVYQTLVWGGPYLMGRLYLADDDGRRAFAQVLTAAGLVYTPFCLVEMVREPFVYELIYGFHPHEMEGARRWLGFRPLVFLEHGNALGIWMAGIAVIGWISWRSGVLHRWPRVLSASAGIGLPIVAVLTQAIGPVLVMIAAFTAWALAPWLRWWLVVALLCLPLAGYVGYRMSGPERIKPLIRRTLGADVLDQLRQVPTAKSFGWRVLREEEHTSRVQQRPLLGHARWDWWRGEHAAPWSLWMLSVGMYGVVGLVMLMACFIVPISIFLWYRPPPQWHSSPAVSVQAALGLMLAMMLVDNMLNSTLNVVLVMAAGAITVMSSNSDIRETKSAAHTAQGLLAVSSVDRSERT